MVMPVTATASGVTVTVAVPFFPLPSLAVAVMVAVPGAMASTRPVVLTVATAVLLVVHVTDLSSASSGATAAVNCCVPPTVSGAVAGLTVTPVTATAPFSSLSQPTTIAKAIRRTANALRAMKWPQAADKAAAPPDKCATRDEIVLKKFFFITVLF